jgi:hypothetical protein
MARLHDVVFDSHHPASIARFWAAALDGYQVAPYDEAELARLRGKGIFDPEDDPNVLVEAPGGRPRIFFQLVPEPKVVKNRVHLDLRCDCVEDELERLSELGARVVSEFDDHLVLCDPEGNEFCLSGPARSWPLDLILQQHLVMCRLLACQGEGGGFGPLSFNGLLGHEGDCGGLCVDGQAAPDGLLGSMQVGEGAPAADGQVGGGVAELALVWREGGKGVGDRARQGTEGAGVARGEPEHLIAEPGGAIELEAERAERREQVLKPGELRRADCLGRHERGEHGDVGRDAEPGTGVEAFPVPRHGGFGFWDLDHQAAVRAGDCHGGTLTR